MWKPWPALPKESVKELAVERRISEAGGRVAGKDPAGRRCSVIKRQKSESVS